MRPTLEWQEDSRFLSRSRKAGTWRFPNPEHSIPECHIQDLRSDMKKEFATCEMAFPGGCPCEETLSDMQSSSGKLQAGNQGLILMCQEVEQCQGGIRGERTACLVVREAGEAGSTKSVPGLPLSGSLPDRNVAGVLNRTINRTQIGMTVWRRILPKTKPTHIF